MGNLGNAYSALGKSERAITFYQRALNIAQEIGDRHGEGVSLANLGITLAKLDKENEAKVALEQSVEILSQFDSPFLQVPQSVLQALSTTES